MVSIVLIKVDTKDINDIRRGLIGLCSKDNDMNGENGPDYLWDEAEGYGSNAEYLADKVIKESAGNVRTMFETFIKTWKQRDKYYKDCSQDYLVDKKNHTLTIACAWGW